MSSSRYLSAVDQRCASVAMRPDTEWRAWSRSWLNPGSSGMREVFSRPSMPASAASRADALQSWPVTGTPRTCASSTIASRIARVMRCVARIASTFSVVTARRTMRRASSGESAA